MELKYTREELTAVCINRSMCWLLPCDPLSLPCPNSRPDPGKEGKEGRATDKHWAKKGHRTSGSRWSSAAVEDGGCGWKWGYLGIEFRVDQWCTKIEEEAAPENTIVVRVEGKGRRWNGKINHRGRKGSASVTTPDSLAMKTEYENFLL